MKNISQLMKQAEKMQAQMAEAQEKLSHAEVTGQSGAGLVQVVMNGKGEVKKITLDKALIVPDEVDVLEDLIVAALADGKTKIDAHTAEEMSKVTGGLSLPGGFKLPF
jgi:hypothetical protein